jgi:hypothetical protein
MPQEPQNIESFSGGLLAVILMRNAGSGLISPHLKGESKVRIPGRCTSKGAFLEKRHSYGKGASFPDTPCTWFR